MMESMDLTDDELVQALEQQASRVPNTTSVGTTNSNSNTNAPSFQAAFSSFTTSSLYTSVAQMPLPPPRTAPPISARAAVAQLGQTIQQEKMGGTTTTIATTPSTTTGAATGMISSTRPNVVQPANKPMVGSVASKPTSAHTILVSPRQKGNPVLVHLSHIAWEYGEKTMLPDYELSDTGCALYISMKYHMLHPNYLQTRLYPIKQHYTTRIILVLVDVEDSDKPMLDLTRQSFAFSWTLVCCWSPEEMARYLETFKLYEKKTSDAIQERVDETDLKSKLLESLTMVRSINKTDVNNLIHNFHSFSGIATASKEDLSNCPGMGEKKVHRLFHVMNQPFITSQPAPRPDDTSAGLTPAQNAAIHQANVLKAQQTALQASQQKKGAIKYVDPIHAATLNQARVTTTPSTTAASSYATRIPPASASGDSSASLGFDRHSITLPSSLPSSNISTVASISSLAAASAQRSNAHPPLTAASSSVSTSESTLPSTTAIQLSTNAPVDFDPNDFIS